jgi:hypothetical protein
MKALTYMQHYQVLINLVKIGNSVDITKIKSDLSYASLMICFLLKELSISRSLIQLFDKSNISSFPSTACYVLCRSMLEIDINAHYISVDPIVRSRLYINYKKVLTKKQMDVCNKNRNSKKADWQYASNMEWNEYWEKREIKVKEEYEIIRSSYLRKRKNGKDYETNNWAGISIHEMAKEVDHKESYDYFYAFLSLFVHGDIEEIDRYLKVGPNSLKWSDETNEFDVGNVFRNASTFLHCFLTLFGKSFNLWEKQTVDNCWNV